MEKKKILNTHPVLPPTVHLLRLAERKHWDHGGPEFKGKPNETFMTTDYGNLLCSLSTPTTREKHLPLSSHYHCNGFVVMETMSHRRTSHLPYSPSLDRVWGEREKEKAGRERERGRESDGIRKYRREREQNEKKMKMKNEK